MPGVNGPVDLQFLAEFRDIKNRLRALETQQQSTVTDSQGRPVMNIGLVPGSNPPRYGTQYLDPATGDEIAFFGFDSSTGQVVNLTLGGGSSIQSGDFNGSLPSTAGTTGWALGGSGDNAIFNNLVLRGGIIGNDALTSPVYPAVCHFDTANFSLSTSYVQLLSGNVSIPSGYTKALITMSGSGTARNKNTTQDFWQIGLRANGVANPGYTALQDGAPGYTIGLALTNAFLLTGLTGGGSFTLSVWGSSGLVNWAADSYNALNLDAVILFLR